MQPQNVHGTALVLGDKGLLITGRSGAGKTALALALIQRVRGRGRFASLIADDQIFVRDVGGRLVAESPESIRGMVEIYGIGPVGCAGEDRAVIDLVIRLVEEDAAPRFQEEATGTIAGLSVPAITLAERNMRGAMAAIFSRLSFDGL